jgi:ribonuclease P protein component
LESLSNQADFLYFKREGKKNVGKFFLVVVTPKTSLSGVFLEDSLLTGIKVTKKFGNAVKRNNLKRRIRHMLRELVKMYPAFIKSLAYLIIPKASLSLAKFELALADLVYLIKKIHNAYC